MDMVSLASDVLQGIGIIVVAALFYETASTRFSSTGMRKAALAVLFSLGGVLPMLAAREPTQIPFDMGNVFVMLATVYGGWWAAIGSALAAGLGRVWLDDPAAILGVVLSSAVGFAFARAVHQRAISTATLTLAGGFNALALLAIFALPWQSLERVHGAGVLPALAVLVVGTVVVGRIFELQKARMRPRGSGPSQAVTDPATGLLNRRVFDKLGPELAEAMNWAGQPYSMAIVDIDAFDELVERHGGTAGDEAVGYLASIIQESVRQTDMVARFGIQSIALVLPAYDAERAFGLAERIQNAVEKAPFRIGDIPVPITVSVGLHTPLSRRNGFWTALGQADTALSRARSAGRSRVEVAG